MNMQRQVEMEWLDVLDADDARARRSRSDLRRINLLMGSTAIAVAALDRAIGAAPPRTILELGAGDGSLMAAIAARRHERWAGVQVTLLDRQPVIAADALARLRDAGWQAHVVTADALDWLAGSPAHGFDVVFANLFVHHFTGDALARLLAGVAAHGRAFACCEPRRGRLALAASHLVAVAGAGDVARHDAVSSVRAGFVGHELSSLWPVAGRWSLDEYEAGLFTHCLVAVRA
jgi:protein-L-isoaspartate O-methyltransferase